MTAPQDDGADRWEARQRAMLAQMGIQGWSRPVVTAAADPATPAVGRDTPAPSAPATASAPPPRATADMRPLPGLGSMDGPALRAAVAGCTACGLSHGRTQAVFGVGHERAHWMIVGEAPGEQEDRLGEPFVGPSGQLLDNMLRAVGLSRSPQPQGDPARQVFITNALKCRPPVNRNPRPEELAQCAPFLRRQVALVRPRLILAMGRFAVQSLLGSDAPIGQLRGQVHHCEGVPTVVTYHPAYLLRNPTDKARAWEDLCLARRVAAAAELDAAPAGDRAGPAEPSA
jgi:uracil-DNA glycosylase family 4